MSRLTFYTHGVSRLYSQELSKTVAQFVSVILTLLSPHTRPRGPYLTQLRDDENSQATGKGRPYRKGKNIFRRGRGTDKGTS